MDEPKYPLEEVFTTVGLPPHTYIKPKHYSDVRLDILQRGRHVLIEGPSGAGKSCVVYKVFEELGWTRDREYTFVNGRVERALAQIHAFLNDHLDGGVSALPVLVVDDFHFLHPDERSEIGKKLKLLSDLAFESGSAAKVVLIGIPMAGASLLSNANDLSARLGIHRLTPGAPREIDLLIQAGEQVLGVLFEEHDIIAAESGGNFWLAQFICGKICSAEDVRETLEESRVLSCDLLELRGRVMSDLERKYLPALCAFANGKNPHPGGNKPFLEILLAITNIPDSVIPFDRILRTVADRRRPGIIAVRRRIPEIIQQIKDLKQHLSFDGSAFSIEDPLLRYFLSNLDAAVLYTELGIDGTTLEYARQYSFDIGFSYAGEAREIVSVVNDELTKLDVSTFYDQDQQPALLGADLERVMKSIYDSSCRFYLVFLDRYYLEKGWTRLEKEIMTSSGRKSHIIPVILDEEGKRGTHGIPAGTGGFDLSEYWTKLRSTGKLTREIRLGIKNRCVLPLIEKLSELPPDE